MFAWISSLFLMAIERPQLASMVGTSSTFSTRLAIRSVGAFNDVAVSRVVGCIEAGYAVEIVAEARWWNINQLPRRKIITPGIIIDGLAFGLWSRCRGWLCRRHRSCRHLANSSQDWKARLSRTVRPAVLGGSTSPSRHRSEL